MTTLESLLKKSIDFHMTLDNILREEIHHFVLFYLNQTKFFFEGVFQGGTSLRIIYGNHRFSEDLDFVFKQKNSTTFQEIESILHDIPKQINTWYPFLEVLPSKWQKATDSLKRFQIKLNCRGLASTLMIQLEFVNVPAYDLKSPILHYDIYSFAISAESLEEILTDKVLAFGLRNYIKGRDIWDIFFLKHEKQIDFSYRKNIQLLENKLSDYGYTKEEYGIKLKNNLMVFRENGLTILKSELTRFFDQESTEMTLAKLEEIISFVLHFLDHFLEEFTNEH